MPSQELEQYLQQTYKMPQTQPVGDDLTGERARATEEILRLKKKNKQAPTFTSVTNEILKPDSSVVNEKSKSNLTNIAEELNKPGLLKTGADVVTGFAKEAFDRPRSVAQLGQEIATPKAGSPTEFNTNFWANNVLKPILSKILSPEQMKKVNETLVSVQQGMQEGVEKPEYAKSTNTAQQVGGLLENVAEFAVTGGQSAAAKGAAKAALTETKSVPLAETALNLAKKSLKEGIATGGVTAAQTGDIKQGETAGIIGATIPVLSGILKGGGKLLAEKAIPLSEKEAGLIQSYQAKIPFWQRVLNGITGEGKAPTTAGATAFNKGIAGTESMIGVQAKKASTNLWDNLISPSLKKSNVKQDMPTFFQELKQQIIKNNPELSRQKDLLEGLNALKEDYAKKKIATMEDLQNFKEGWAKFVPEKTYRGKPIAGIFNEVKDTAAGLARNKIYEALGPEAKQAYFDYGNLKGLQELGKKSMTGSKLKGGAGTFVSALKDMAITPIGTVGGKIIYRTGEGIELFGKPGAKTISDIMTDEEIMISSFP